MPTRIDNAPNPYSPLQNAVGRRLPPGPRAASQARDAVQVRDAVQPKAEAPAKKGGLRGLFARPAPEKDPRQFAKGQGAKTLSSVPAEAWEKIFAADPISALAVNSVSRDVRAATQFAADRVNAIAQPILKLPVKPTERQLHAGAHFVEATTPELQCAIDSIDYSKKAMERAAERFRKAPMYNLWRRLPGIQEFHTLKLPPREAVDRLVGHVIWAPLFAVGNVIGQAVEANNAPSYRRDYQMEKAHLKRATQRRNEHISRLAGEVIERHGWLPNAPTSLTLGRR